MTKRYPIHKTNFSKFNDGSIVKMRAVKEKDGVFCAKVSGCIAILQAGFDTAMAEKGIEGPHYFVIKDFLVS